LLSYDNIQYIGERALIGKVGHVLVILSFVLAALSAVAYFLSANSSTENKQLKSLGRWSFIAHSISTLSMIGLLFFMLLNQYFEYQYVWKYSNTQMPLKYIFSCFWGGQEGSLLLWMFWQVVLGLILLFSSKQWESHVMALFALVNALISSTLLGVYIFDFHIGSNPFLLAREHADNFGMAWTFNANYLQELPTYKTGYGLNPLLQNYWMTIHPPVLFLGFAATLIPFVYAIAALQRKQLHEWTKPALPWAFFGVLVLGVGILLGGAWAYESLSFGGFWAWDPVENASFIPWIILVAAAHVMLIVKYRKTSIFTALFFTPLAFILVFYSTFLTRSGVLGESSVHSFTGEGMLGQLLVYLLLLVFILIYSLMQDKTLKIRFSIFALALVLIQLFIPIEFNLGTASITTKSIVTSLAFLGSVYFLISAYNKHYNLQKDEDHLWSREFWMFIGSLVLALAALQILLPTSIPVWNKLFGTAIDPITETAERNAFYNKWQVPFAFFITFIVAISQYLSYKKSNFKNFVKKLAFGFFASLALTLLLRFFLFTQSWSFSKDLLLFSSLFAILGNAYYYVNVLKGKLNHAGSSIAHVGFGLIILGALISNGQKNIISENDLDAFRLKFLSEDFDNNSDIQLIKGDTVLMKDYFVSYAGKSKEGININYHINYFSKKPNNYKKGDRVKFQDQPFEALEDHETSDNFEKDSKYWVPVAVQTQLDYFSLKKWNGYKADEKLFELTPFVQTNEQFGNVPEPGTKHFLTHDIFTHVRFADLEVIPSEDDDYMPSSVYSAHFKKDTVITPNFKIILDTIELVMPEEYEKYMLSKNDVACKVKMKFYSIYDRAGTEFIAEPLLIRRDAITHIPDFYESKELNMKVGVEDNLELFRFLIQNLPTAKGEISENEKIKLEDIEVRFGLANKEFIVLQAIVFPYINLLWIGILIMMIGTAMAIIYRVKRTKKDAID
jgi:cytochrome c-type biogenesis protein CcmF